jgi:hypothetical protein
MRRKNFQLRDRTISTPQITLPPLRLRKIPEALVRRVRARARASFRTAGEQIDASFQHEGTTYLVEAKWRRVQTNAAMLHAFQGKTRSGRYGRADCM